jgi:hypothetical protein
MVFLFDLLKDAVNLLLKHSFQLGSHVTVEVVLVAELLSQRLGGVALHNSDALTHVSEIDIYEKKRLSTFLHVVWKDKLKAYWNPWKGCEGWWSPATVLGSEWSHRQKHLLCGFHDQHAPHRTELAE